MTISLFFISGLPTRKEHVIQICKDPKGKIVFNVKWDGFRDDIFSFALNTCNIYLSYGHSVDYGLYISK